MDCRNYPFLRLVNTTLRNLGGKGPDTGVQKGLIYAVRVRGGPNDGEEFELRVNVTSPEADFHPQSAEEIGFQGRYGSINIKAGSNVTLDIEQFDPRTNKPIPFDDFYFTFFDVDQGPRGEARESITLGQLSGAYIANQSEVNVTTLEDGRLRFSATAEGTGVDNPKDPLNLTKKQFRRAVTVAVKGIPKLQVTLAVGPSEVDNPRWFNFRGQPSLLCATRTDGSPLQLQEFGTIGSAGSGRSYLSGFMVFLFLLSGSCTLVLATNLQCEDSEPSSAHAGSERPTD